MMTRTLYRRLERLEEQTMPMDEPRVWQIIVLESDGTQTLGDTIEWRSRGPLGTNFATVEGDSDHRDDMHRVGRSLPIMRLNGQLPGT